MRSVYVLIPPNYRLLNCSKRNFYAFVQHTKSHLDLSSYQVFGILNDFFYNKTVPANNSTMNSIILILISILICVSVSLCDSFETIQPINDSVSVQPVGTIFNNGASDLVENLLMQIKNIISEPVQTNTSRSSTEKLYQKDSNNLRQSSLLPVLPDFPPFFNAIRNYFKTIYRSYLLLNPEVNFGQCIAKYLYIEYPLVMRIFQRQNITIFLRRLYVVAGKFINNIINRYIFDWSDTEFDRQRIGLKVALITNDNRLPSENLPQSNIYQNYYRNYATPYQQIVPTIGYTHARSRFVRQVVNPKSNQTKYVEDMKPTENTKPHELDPDATIDLRNRDIEREAENLFNIDVMFWRSLGIQENSFKRYSLAYCTKEYLTESFRRFMKNVILS